MNVFGVQLQRLAPRPLLRRLPRSHVRRLSRLVLGPFRRLTSDSLLNALRPQLRRPREFGLALGIGLSGAEHGLEGHARRARTLLEEHAHRFEVAHDHTLREHGDVVAWAVDRFEVGTRIDEHTTCLKVIVHPKRPHERREPRR